MTKLLSFFVAAVFSIQAFALMKVKPGTYELEGYLAFADQNVIYFTINKGSDAEINFILSGKETAALINKDSRKVLIEIRVDREFISNIGFAELIKIKKEVDNKVKVYHLPGDLKIIK